MAKRHYHEVTIAGRAISLVCCDATRCEPMAIALQALDELALELRKAVRGGDYRVKQVESE